MDWTGQFKTAALSDTGRYPDFFLPVETDCFGSLFIGDGQSDLHYCNVLFFYRQMYFIVAGQDFAIVSKDRSLIAQFELIDMQEFINFLLQGGVNTVFKKASVSCPSAVIVR